MSKTINEVKEAIIALLEKRLNAMVPGTKTVDAYRETIMGMSESQLENWILALENGVQDFPDMSKPSATVTLVVPNMGDQIMDIERNKKLAEEMGVNFFERCWITDPVTGQCYLTNRKYITLLLPVRRQAQTLAHKIAVTTSDTNIDDLTGQVTGDSKESSISYPEIQMLAAQGLTSTLEELVKVRGGDQTAWSYMKQGLTTTGEFNAATLDNINSRAKVNDALKWYLQGAHIKSNL